MNDKINKQDYYNWINELKSKIHAAQTKVALTINSQLLELYWEIGKDIFERQENTDWGSKFIEQTAIELKNEFPEVRGFSRRNLYAIRQWYRFYAEKYQFVPRFVAQIPWGHNRLIISKIKDVEEAEFYCHETIKNGWNRDTLEIQMDNNLFIKKGNAITNFQETLPLRDINKPMGISEYKLTDAIPENIKTKLPSIEELENKLTEKMKNPGVKNV